MVEDSDEQAFREAMADVEPVGKGRQQKLAVNSVPTPGQLQMQADAQEEKSDLADPNFLTLGDVPSVEPLAFVEWRKQGVQLGVFDKLRKGGYPAQAELDLHRKTVKEAREMVYKFIQLAIAKGLRSVSMSPGKGELSKTPGRLKSYTVAWLTEHPDVIAFCSAERQRGGVGSIYVLLRKSEQSRELARELLGLKSEAPDS